MIYKIQPRNFHSTVDIVACFVEHEGNILFLKRQPHKPNGGLWGLPAGKVDPGEDLQTAIKREVWEETGITLTLADTDQTTVFVDHAGYQFTYHMYREVCATRPPVTLNPEEHQSYQWVAREESLSLPQIEDQPECTQLFYRQG